MKRLLLCLALAAFLALPARPDPSGAPTGGTTQPGADGLGLHPKIPVPRSTGARTSRLALPRTLEADLRARLLRSPFRGGRVGAVVISLDDGHVVFEHQADALLTPASTMKALTGAAILDRLGPDWRFGTRFVARGPVNDGVLEGDLYVVGTCAPDLTVERFPEIAQGVLAAGIREVRGDIVADLSFFDGEERPPEWPHGSRPNPYSSPISALAANFSSVRVTVSPGPKPGAPALVEVEPAGDALLLSLRVGTVSRGGRSIWASRRLERGKDGQVANRIIVSGRIPTYAASWEDFIPIEDPSGVAISAVKRALQRGGVVVDGTTRTGVAPDGARTVFTLQSKPLSEIVMDMNKHSNNFIAEMLQRTLGAAVHGLPATREKGADAVLAFLRTCGAETDGVVLTDGSGLSHSNRVTANVLARVLVRMNGDPRLESAFLDSLPIGGVDGTLRTRMYGVARGRVRAKTGHINGVTTLTGYVDDTSDGPVAFAFLVNDVSHPRAKRGIDDLCRILCLPR